MGEIKSYLTRYSVREVILREEKHSEIFTSQHFEVLQPSRAFENVGKRDEPLLPPTVAGWICFIFSVFPFPSYNICNPVRRTCTKDISLHRVS